MPKTRIDLTGKSVGLLTYTHPVSYKDGAGWLWSADCKCGRKTTNYAGLIRRKKSCGCLSVSHPNHIAWTDK